MALVLMAFFTACDTQFQDQTDAGSDELTIAETEISALKTMESMDEEVNAARFAAHLRGIYNPFFVVPRHHFGEHFPDCATVTVDRDSFPKTVTIVYGEDCVTRRGIKKSGTVIITLSDSVHTPGSTYSVQYIDLQLGNKLINLEASYTYEGLNENNNPVVSWESYSTTIKRDSIVIKRRFSHTKEWLSGFRTAYIDDDQFLLTGGGQVKINDRYEFSRVIIDPLYFDRACRFILSGVIEITRNGESMLIDFGDGECDNIATVTKDGESAEIELISERFKDRFQRRDKNMRQENGWW